MPDGIFDERVPNRTPSYAYRQWSEWSLRGGNVGMARRYGLKAISLAPWSPRCWRALALSCVPGARNEARSHLAEKSKQALQSTVITKAK